LSENRGNNSVEFSKGHKYYINTWSSAQQPYVVSLHSGSGKIIRNLADNKKMFEVLNQYNWSPKEFLTVKNSEGQDLNAWMIKPANFDPAKKYPVYMVVYGGPGQQTVMNQWDYTATWYNLLAQKGYIVFSVDNRGTDGRGYQFRRATYGQMGKVESQDQADAAKYLQSLAYVDADRIGIQGWSYGGYMSTLCLEKYPEIFKMAIAVAPVTNWRFYDSVYSERYLGLPSDNPEGYDANSPTNPELVKNMKGHFLLIHGSADDNVHLQNTMELSKLLIEANFDYQEMIYPNKNHSIYGGNTRMHLFNKMTKFIEENL
jgi:dipeptidyl-peptidase-4